MSRRRFQFWSRRAVALLALLAVVARLGAAMAMPMPREASLAALLGVQICHAPGSDQPADPALPAAHDCQLCPACISFAPILTATPAAASAASAAVPVCYLLRPPGAGPPTAARDDAQPRGSPLSV